MYSKALKEIPENFSVENDILKKCVFEALQKVPKRGFKANYRLQEFIAPQCTEVMPYAFYNSKAMQKLVMPLQRIHSDAFHRTSFKRLYFPLVKKVEFSAFASSDIK